MLMRAHIYSVAFSRQQSLHRLAVNPAYASVVVGGARYLHLLVLNFPVIHFNRSFHKIEV